MNKMKLDVIEIQVKEWDEMVRWYNEILGLKILAKENEDKFALLVGENGAAVGLFGKENLSDLKGNITPYWHVDNIENTFQSLSAKGVRFVANIEKRHWGKQARFVDPEDNNHFIYQEKGYD